MGGIRPATILFRRTEIYIRPRAYTDGSDFSNELSCDGRTTVSGNAKIFGDNATYTGNWNIAGKAIAGETTSTIQSNFGNATINIDRGGNLATKNSEQFSI